MADWDADSPQLAANIETVLNLLVRKATRRDKLTLSLVKKWHAGTMAGLNVPNSAWVGSFRGEKGLETVGVVIGGKPGVSAASVKAELGIFEKALQEDIAKLDKDYPPSKALDVKGFAEVVDLAAWAHSEWVRIHPFANGNGRTARLLANFIFVRYDIGLVVQVRPRPNGAYEKAAAECMAKDHTPMSGVFVQMIVAYASPQSVASAKAANAAPAAPAKKAPAAPAPAPKTGKKTK